jgi:hypothetical protein
VQDVAFIFDIFDDRDQNAGIALPQENAFDFSDGIARDEILDLAIIVGQDDDGNIKAGAFDLAGQLRGVHITDGEIGDDEIEARLGAGQLHGFRATGDVGNSRELAQVEFKRFVDEQLVEAAVFTENEGIVKAGDEKDIVHLEGHQILEAFKALFGVHGDHGIGEAVSRHESHTLVYAVAIVIRLGGQLGRGGYVLGFAIAERPVFFRHLNQIDEDIFPAQFQAFVQAVGNGFVEALLHLDGATAVQRDLQEDAIVRAMDAEIIAVELQNLFWDAR